MRAIGPREVFALHLHRVRALQRRVQVEPHALALEVGAGEA